MASGERLKWPARTAIASPIATSPPSYGSEPRFTEVRARAPPVRPDPSTKSLHASGLDPVAIPCRFRGKVHDQQELGPASVDDGMMVEVGPKIAKK